MIFRKTLIIFMATLLAYGPARADVSSDLNDFWNDLGGTINVTPGTAFAGQSAGYYTGGNIRARFPSRNTAIFTATPPGFAGGCGGIDIFAGSLSFINKDELIQLSRAIAANAVGYAFDLALETISPVIAETMKDLRARLQELNLNNINSCETAQGLLDTVVGKQSLARNKLCERVGTVKGIFQDSADAKDACGTPAAFATATARNTEEEDAYSLVDINLTWEFMRGDGRVPRTDWLANDRQLAEFAMTLTGTIIYGDENGDKTYYPPRIDNQPTLDQLYEGGSLQYYRCDEAEQCLNITLDNLAIPENISVRGRVAAAVDRLIEDIEENQRPSDADVAMVNGTAIPLWRVLNVYAAGGSVILQTQKEPIIDLVANDIMLRWIENLVDSVAFRAQSSQVSGDTEVEEWKKQLRVTKGVVTEKRSKLNSNFKHVIDLTNRVFLIEKRLSYYLANSTGSSLWAHAPGVE